MCKTDYSCLQCESTILALEDVIMGDCINSSYWMYKLHFITYDGWVTGMVSFKIKILQWLLETSGIHWCCSVKNSNLIRIHKLYFS